MITVVAALLAATATAGIVSASLSIEQETCVLRQPGYAVQGKVQSPRIGYELIDFLRREAWVTIDWSPEEYAQFSLPITALHWHKNDPRISYAHVAKPMRSPECENNGEFTFIRAFGREFFHIANLAIEFRNHDSLIWEAAVHKFHRLQFRAGDKFSILRAPDGAKFVGVNRPYETSADVPILPEGWTIKAEALDQSKKVDLFGDVRVLRLNNGASYQGPVYSE